MIERRVRKQRGRRLIRAHARIGHEQCAIVVRKVNGRAGIQQTDQIDQCHIAGNERRIRRLPQILAIVSEVALDLGPARKALYRGIGGEREQEKSEAIQTRMIDEVVAHT